GFGEGVSVTRMGVTVTGTTVGGIVTVGSSVGSSNSCVLGVKGTRTVGEFGFVGGAGGGAGFNPHAASANPHNSNIKMRFTFIRSTRLLSVPPHPPRRLLARRVLAQRVLERRFLAQRPLPPLW